MVSGGYQIVSSCIRGNSSSDALAGRRYDVRMAKVLLIDDDQKHSRLLQAYFKRFGIHLVCAADANEGFRKLNREEPDLLLLDVMLPGKDGFEICREIRKTSNLPIISMRSIRWPPRPANPGRSVQSTLRLVSFHESCETVWHGPG
jgi:PleD family two-component response regulator